MDHLAHELPVNPRKRKAETDDPPEQPPQDPQDVILPDPAAVANPRQVWRQTAEMWPAALACRQKRPRLEKQDAPMSPTRRLARRKPPRSPPHPRLGNDLEDIGIVSPASDPGPSSGSLLRLRDTVFTKSIPSAISSIAIDPNSAHIPPLQSPINRNTLKELDLDVIIRNPQLRTF
jgi:hypothetical protein